MVVYRVIKMSHFQRYVYVTSKNSAGVRRVIADLRLGYLQLAVEVGRYTSMCGTGELEDQHLFLINCPSLSHIRQNIFTYCNTILRSFSREPSIQCKFLLSHSDGIAMFLVYQMYQLRQSVLCQSINY